MQGHSYRSSGRTHSSDSSNVPTESALPSAEADRNQAVAQHDCNKVGQCPACTGVPLVYASVEAHRSQPQSGDAHCVVLHPATPHFGTQHMVDSTIPAPHIFDDIGWGTMNTRAMHMCGQKARSPPNICNMCCSSFPKHSATPACRKLRQNG